MVLSALALLVFGLFCFSIFYLTRLLPTSGEAPGVGRQAPDFTLSDANGTPVTLSEVLKNHHAAVLIFYRGYW